ncbi:MAG: phosphatase PAP2 family protein, partial [Campylobacterota bacterium]|nr:phosphatase PAP2 family protein [Campylobacterota bacterium]
MTIQSLSTIIFFSIIFIILSYFYIDESVAHFAFANDATLSPIFAALSHGADSTYWLIGSAVLWLIWKYYKKNEERAKMVGFMFIAIVTTGLSVNLLKMFFGKARPILLKKEEIFGFDWFVLPSAYDYHSFPSGHTTTAFTIATVLTLIFPRYWPAFYGYAIVMALSRVLNWNHYVSDVLAGALFGTIATLLLFGIKKI